MRSKSAASICRLKSALNSRRLQQPAGAVLCKCGGRRVVTCNTDLFAAEGIAAIAADLLHLEPVCKSQSKHSLQTV